MQVLSAGELDRLGALTRGHVRVFFTRVEESEDSVANEPRRALLSDDERERQLRFHFAQDRQSYLFAHALTRSVLSALTGTAPPELRFESGSHGRPELCHPRCDPALRFNLSHTRGMVACAVASELDIGVDVEQVTRRLELAQLARQVFSEREREALFALAEEAQRERFFRLWTLKESYIKAIGKGLSVPLRSISLELEHPVHPQIAFAPPIVDSSELWSFRCWPAEPNHMLSVAARSEASPEFALYELRI